MYHYIWTKIVPDILPNGEFAPPPISRQEDPTRRRIEIRFTCLGEVTQLQ